MKIDVASAFSSRHVTTKTHLSHDKPDVTGTWLHDRRAELPKSIRTVPKTGVLTQFESESFREKVDDNQQLNNPI